VAGERSYSLREAINTVSTAYEPPQTAFSLNSDLLPANLAWRRQVQTVATAAATPFVMIALWKYRPDLQALSYPLVGAAQRAFAGELGNAGSHRRSNGRTATASRTLRRVACASGTRQYLQGSEPNQRPQIAPSVRSCTEIESLNEFVAERKSETAV